jgi:hypothetical protein
VHACHEGITIPEGNAGKTCGSHEGLKRGVDQSKKNDIWDPVHPKDMSAEERKLIISQMMNYLEKYRPDLNFEKFKV